MFFERSQYVPEFRTCAAAPIHGWPMLAVYIDLGAFLPRRESTRTSLQQFFNQNAGSFWESIRNLFSGGNFRRLTIFALGHHAVITASIILAN